MLKEAGATRGKKEYIDLTTQKSGSIFTTRTLRGLSDTYLELQERYEKLQSSLVKEVVNIACMSLALGFGCQDEGPSIEANWVSLILPTV